MATTVTGGGSAADASAAAALAYPEPRRRSLQIYAVDPMIARLSGNEVVTITVPYEPLLPGPSGDLVQVIDYDASTRQFYTPVDLDSPVLLAQDGLAPSERDPRFHQQMVYAVTSSLLENFERGLGRRFRWRGNERLRIFPHGFQGENAVFDDGEGGSLRFGYFRTDPRDAGRNLPGQWVFSCLSHDIVVHEATHALVDRLRPLYKEATNIDVYAFHEGFADVVALFQHFALPDLLARYIQSNRADLTARSPLVELAQQFGESTGRGRALRDALGEEPDPTRLSRTLEPHARGSIFVSAVFDAFFTTYQAAIADLIRIATAGSGQLPPGALHPDLVARVAGEARAMAQRVLMMCIRAFQYLPPVDVTFGDFLRSAVTADCDLFPADGLGLRAALVEGFRKRGIYPDGVSGLADEAVAWPAAAELGLPPLDVVAVVEPLVAETALGFRSRRSAAEDTPERKERRQGVAKALSAYARRHAGALGLDRRLKIQVRSFHAVFRQASSGLLQVNVIVQIVQTAPPEVARARDVGGIELRGGVTLVADVDGEVRAVVSRPTPGLDPVGNPGGAARFEALGAFVDQFDDVDLPGPWRIDDPTATWPSLAHRRGRERRIAASLTLGRLDRGRPW
ncbi:hypothetical protein GCM10022204_20160 [Microlunatus aurantiacus]|uniref:Uncharacterized protein n=1 Tax=Microlunatus aurantiacus TaxID=446786 RepID=A0ABP7DAR7_9ACTN